MSTLTDVAQQAGSQAKQTASSMAAEASQGAKGFLNSQVAAGADLAGHVANSVRSAADKLEQNAPQLAGLVRGAAQGVEGFSRDMRDQSVEDLWRTASDFSRKQPALVFGLASLAGFLLFRVLEGQFQRVASAAAGSIRAAKGTARIRGKPMALDRLQNSALAQAFTGLLADFGDLAQKEMQLAKAEVTEKITSWLHASIWMVAAGLLGIDRRSCWSSRPPCLRSRASDWRCTGRAWWWRRCWQPPRSRPSTTGARLRTTTCCPKRSARQISQDIRTAKEQLT